MDVQAWRRRMGSPMNGAMWLVAMIVVIVGMDLLFFRDATWTWERLAANVGTVLLFGAFFFRFVLRS